jgi:hypothetical protein
MTRLSGPWSRKGGHRERGAGKDGVVAGAPRDGGEQLVGGLRRRGPGRATREFDARGHAPGEDGGAVVLDHAPLAEGVAPRELYDLGFEASRAPAERARIQLGPSGVASLAPAVTRVPRRTERAGAAGRAAESRRGSP